MGRASRQTCVTLGVYDWASGSGIVRVAEAHSHRAAATLEYQLHRSKLDCYGSAWNNIDGPREHNRNTCKRKVSSLIPSACNILAVMKSPSEL